MDGKGPAIALTLCLIGLAPTTGAVVQDEKTARYTAAGGHLALEVPSDPATVVDEERALGATTCSVPGGPPAIPAPPTGSLGGACFNVGDYPDNALISVQVTLDLVTVPEYSLDFAVGYDGDDDGCVGCTRNDTLWQADGATTIPVLEDEDSLAVFVYGVNADNDPADADGAASIVTTGTITVEQIGASDVTCPDDPANEEDRCGVSLATPRPHLCVASCKPPMSIQ